MKAFVLLILAGLLESVPAAETFGYWIEPCTAPELRCEDGDGQLVRWALEAWQKASGGSLLISPAAASRARIRIYWASGREGLYGETRGTARNEAFGADVYLRTTLDGLGPEIAAAGNTDRLFRQTIVYLTALHETGHALGLPHTRGFDDIMYNFAYGGDFVEYFRRYRRKLRTTESIASVSGLSEEDVRRLRTIYGGSEQK